MAAEAMAAEAMAAEAMAVKAMRWAIHRLRPTALSAVEPR
jgi:hypothetical protein